MNRGMIYKGIFILLLILFAIILILPSVGSKKLEITLTGDVLPQEIKIIMDRFSADKFSVTKADGKILVQAGGLNITDAVMNELKIFKGVKDVKILPHWAEKAVLAKKINFGLDLQGGMELVMMANFNKIKKQYISERDQLIDKKKLLEAKPEGKANLDKSSVDKEIKEIDYQLKDINDNKLNENG